MDYLVHHGILGMKWGIRRYQNKDGSLTPAGQKRYNKLQGELDKLGGRKSSSEGEQQPAKKKTAREMTDDELRSAITRLGLEKNYRDLQRELHPPKQTVWGKIVDKLKNETVPKTVDSLVQKNVTDMINKYVGMKLDQVLFEKFATEAERSERSQKTNKNLWEAENYKQNLELLKSFVNKPIPPDKLIKK